MTNPTHSLHVFKEVLFHAGDANAYRALGIWANANGDTALATAVEEALKNVDDAEADFNRMCIGPYKLTVPPYESVWRSPGRTMNTRYSAAAKYAYAEAGLSVNPDFNELSDFIGNELEFLSILLIAKVEHAAAGNPELSEMAQETADRFWAEHLGHWYKDFLEGIVKESGHPFWGQWAVSLQRVLTEGFGAIELRSTMTGMEVPVSAPVSLKGKDHA